MSVAPEICAPCKLWYTNDGDGLDADRASKLADRLEARLSDGTVDKFIGQKIAYAKSLPNESCTFCGGTGIRTDAVGVKFGYDKRKIDEPGHKRLGQRVGATDVVAMVSSDHMRRTTHSRTVRLWQSLCRF